MNYNAMIRNIKYFPGDFVKISPDLGGDLGFVITIRREQPESDLTYLILHDDKMSQGGTGVLVISENELDRCILGLEKRTVEITDDFLCHNNYCPSKRLGISCNDCVYSGVKRNYAFPGDCIFIPEGRLKGTIFSIGVSILCEDGNFNPLINPAKSLIRMGDFYVDSLTAILMLYREIYDPKGEDMFSFPSISQFLYISEKLEFGFCYCTRARDKIYTQKDFNIRARGQYKFLDPAQANVMCSGCLTCDCENCELNKLLSWNKQKLS